MADNGISVESVEVTLLSGIDMSSATMMVDTYRSHSGEKTGEGPEIPYVQSRDRYLGEGHTGPEARVILTKVVNRTPDEVIEQLHKEKSGLLGNDANKDFYTVLFIMSMRLGDHSTTRLINGMIEMIFPRDTEISGYSPKDKNSITTILENHSDAVFLTPDLNFLASGTRIPKKSPQPRENRFDIRVAPGETLNGMYTPKTGYSLSIPSTLLLEYQGILKNQQEVFWEIYPPMPPHDTQMTGDAMLAVFSLIIRAPKNTLPKMRTIIECRVKGDLWGVIPLKGSTDNL
ncbi:hypothetical protein [uncultured Methanoregula sp.]|uniref:hypothetical protein n=1 Tax=uncultured Methanoregula sp. TaxID=1005933 RepID=UPI002AAAB12C|nr:hypothetical protein [uncultured Methanoregula sp.]